VRASPSARPWQAGGRGARGAARAPASLAAQPTLYTITRAGLRASGTVGVQPCRVSNANAQHLIACAGVAAGSSRCYPDHHVLGERDLRRRERERGAALASARMGSAPGGEQLLHRPDLVLWPREGDAGLPVAVEVELAVKAPDALPRFVVRGPDAAISLACSTSPRPRPSARSCGRSSKQTRGPDTRRASRRAPRGRTSARALKRLAVPGRVTAAPGRLLGILSNRCRSSSMSNSSRAWQRRGRAWGLLRRAAVIASANVEIVRQSLSVSTRRVWTGWRASGVPRSTGGPSRGRPTMLASSAESKRCGD